MPESIMLTTRSVGVYNVDDRIENPNKTCSLLRYVLVVCHNWYVGRLKHGYFLMWTPFSSVIITV